MHTITECYHRYDKEFVPPSSNNNSTAYYSFSDAKDNLIYYTSLDIIGDPDWFLDSGARNQIIAYSSNLQQKAEYKGLDKLVASNGQ